MIYRLLRVLVYHALRVFFRDLQVEGLEDVPQQGPLILAANHPNTLIDVLLVATCLDRQVGFVAKAPLFENPLVGALLRFLGAVPIYRRQDGPLDSGAKQGNKQALAGCEQAVADGRCILIFPEGRSDADQTIRLKKLKTGVARIALGAEQRAPGQVQIVPVALVYDDPEIFRSRARVRFLPPVRVEPFQAKVPEGEDPFSAVRALTAAVRESLETEVVHVDDPELDTLVRDIDGLYARAVRTEAGGRLAATNVIANAVNHFAQEDPERVDRVRQELQTYKQGLETAGVDDGVVRRRGEGPHPVVTFFFWFSLPIVVWGILNHVVWYQIPRVALRLIKADSTYTASLKLGVGLLALFGCYAAQGYGVFQASVRVPELATLWADLGVTTPWTPTLIYMGTLPLAGGVALFWLDGLMSRRRRASALTRRQALDPETLANLERQRDSLVANLDAARVDYLAATLEPETGEPELF